MEQLPQELNINSLFDGLVTDEISSSEKESEAALIDDYFTFMTSSRSEQQSCTHSTELNLFDEYLANATSNASIATVMDRDNFTTTSNKGKVQSPTIFGVDAFSSFIDNSAYVLSNEVMKDSKSLSTELYLNFKLLFLSST